MASAVCSALPNSPETLPLSSAARLDVARARMASQSAWAQVRTTLKDMAEAASIWQSRAAMELPALIMSLRTC